RVRGRGWPDGVARRDWYSRSPRAARFRRLTVLHRFEHQKLYRDGGGHPGGRRKARSRRSGEEVFAEVRAVEQRSERDDDDSRPACPPAGNRQQPDLLVRGLHRADRRRPLLPIAYPRAARWQVPLLELELYAGRPGDRSHDWPELEAVHRRADP